MGRKRPLPDLITGQLDVLLLIALDLRHDVEDTVHIKLARFAQLPHTDGLGQSYKMKVEALRHQGKRSVQPGQKSSRGAVAENAGESETQVQRYIRLTKLTPFDCP